METKDLNQAAKGAEKKNDTKKDGKARKVAGMAGTMAAQGMNTPEDEWQEDTVTAGSTTTAGTSGEQTQTDETGEEEVFDVNEIRIDVEEDDSDLVVIEEEDDETGEDDDGDLAHQPIPSSEEEELIDIDILPENIENPDELIVDVMYGGPDGWEDIEPDMYGGPVDLPEDDPENYLAGGDISDDILI